MLAILFTNRLRFVDSIPRCIAKLHSRFSFDEASTKEKLTKENAVFVGSAPRKLGDFCAAKCRAVAWQAKVNLLAIGKLARISF